jgi:hypothetical protein
MAGQRTLKQFLDCKRRRLHRRFLRPQQDIRCWWHADVRGVSIRAEADGNRPRG